MAEVQVITAQFKVDDGPLQKLLNVLKKGGDEAKALEAAIEAAGVSIDDLGKAAQKTTKVADDGFKSLKQQLKEARNDATLLAQKFGENSVQALGAAKRVAELTEELDDFNQRVKALNPEAKFNAIQGALQGVFGGLQGVTGALQLFGEENKQVEEIARKLQGALNLAQGINSVLGLKDAFANLRIVLGLTTTAQAAAATATTATTVATEAQAAASTAAGVATRGFTAALLSNPITAVAVALAALVSGILIYNAASEDSTELTEEQTKALEEQAKAQEELANRYQSTGKTLQDQIENQRIRTSQSLNQINDLQAKLQQNELDRQRALRDNEFKDDITRIANINKLFGLKEKEIRAEDERAKKIQVTKKANDELIKSMQTLGLVFGDQIISVSDESFTKIQDTLRLVSADAFKVKEDIVKINRELANISPQYTKVAGTSAELNQQLFAKEDELKKSLKRQEDIVRGSLDVITGSLLQFYQEDAARAYEEDADNLERQKERGLITEEQYQARLRNLKRRQAEEQKKQAIFQATLDFSNALINALTIKPAAAIPATTILATIVAGANLARIVATPIPKFKHGTLNVSMGNMDSDGGSLAMLHPGEAVIPKQQNRLYGPSIKAIFKKQIKPEEINAFVQNKLSGKIENRVTADVDTYGLARAMKRNNGVNITNESSLARAIAREMSSTINHRRR